MGLAVSTGMLADLKRHDPEGFEWISESLVSVNEVLVESGLPPHNEPEELAEGDGSRAGSGSFPYSFLHYLRRFYVHATTDPDWTPTPVAEGEDPADDPVVEEESYMFASHLLCHSDCEGFYLPVDFDEVLVDSQDQDRIPGGLLGSSYRLRDELLAIAPALGITVTDGELADAEADRINREGFEEADRFWREKIVWLCLFEAARISIAQNTAIHFG